VSDPYKVFRLLPVLVGAVLSVWLVASTFTGGLQLDLNGALKLVTICAIVLAVVAILRFALGALGEQADPPATGGDGAVRRSLAPLVIGIGTAGILIVALSVLVAINYGRTAPLDPGIYLGVFSSVVPVFATWVGAVIAFYFTNESFRQATQSTNALRGGDADSGPITSAERMIPFDKVTKLVLGAPTKRDGENVPADIAAISMDMVRDLFSDTITRVIVFDAQRQPKLIIRSKLDDRTDATIADYLKRSQNGADAVNFKALPTTATVADGRRLLQLYNVTDLFITDHGTLEEPAKGWVADDKLA
jgi:hypothetical protein